MGNIKNTVNIGMLRIGNTIATPLRRGGEIGNATANIIRQGCSAAKNIAEVTKQTVDALVHNFTHFSRIEGKRYQKLSKGTINFVSAVTRRPVMILGAGIASGINQGIWKPFQKLLYTPGKMFKGIWNATRIFSKKKGFDFVHYDTHETGKDTRVNQIKETNRGFLGVKKGALKSDMKKEKITETSVQKEKTPIINTIPQAKKIEENQEKNKEATKAEEEKKEQKEAKINESQTKKKEEPITTNTSETFNKKDISKQTKQGPSSETPRSFDALEKKHQQEIEAKAAEEQAKKFPAWEDIDEESKQEYIKDYEKVLGGKVDEKTILERGKKHKKGETIDEILTTVKKENPTMAGYFEEILAKKNSASA